MKELTKLILESGLVPKHTAKLLEKWGGLEEGSAELVGKKKVTTETLEDFAKDVAELMETRPIKETVLDDIQVRGQRVIISASSRGTYLCLRDEMGNYFAPTYAHIVKGDSVRVREPDEPDRDSIYLTVRAVTPIYVGDRVVADLLVLSP